MLFLSVYCYKCVFIKEYLCKPIPEFYKKCIAKIRLSSHKLAIEQGRYNKTNRNRRTCKLCINEIEDEMHFILLCPSYVNLREKKISNRITGKSRLFIKCCNY